MLANGQEQRRVPAVPAAGAAVHKDGRRDLASQHVRRHVAVLVRQDVDLCALAALVEVADVGHPLVGVEHAAGAQHVFHVGDAHRQRPVQVVARHVVQQLRQERMAGLGGDEGVVDSRGMRTGRDVRQPHNGRLIEGDATGDVEVDVDAARVVQQGISQDVCALDVLGVAGVVRQDVGIELGDKGRGVDVGPQLVLPVGVQRRARGDCGLVFGDAGVAQGDLVDDLGHDDGVERGRGRSRVLERLQQRRRRVLGVSVQEVWVAVEQRVKGAVCDDNLAQFVDVTAEEDDQPEDGHGGQGHDTSGPHRGRERDED